MGSGDSLLTSVGGPAMCFCYPLFLPFMEMCRLAASLGEKLSAASEWLLGYRVALTE